MKKTFVLAAAVALCAQSFAFAAARIAVLHNTAAGDRLTGAVKEYLDKMTEALDAAARKYVVLTDARVSVRGLAGFQFAILPYNPQMPDKVDALVAGFIAGGGKALLFYELPKQTTAALGVRPVRFLEAGGKPKFEKVRFRKGAIPGAKDFEQSSWNIQIVRPGKEGKVAAEWLDKQGAATGHPAVIVSPGGLYMSHVLFAPDVKRRAQFVKSALAALAKLKRPAAPVAIWRNTHAERTDRKGDGASVGQFVANVKAPLELAGVPFRIISDEAVEAGALDQFKLVIMPLNPSVPRAALRRLERFIRGGGKALVFYSCPRSIGRLLGVSLTPLTGTGGACHRVRVRAEAFNERARAILDGLSFIQGSYHCRGTELAAGAVRAGDWVSRDGVVSPHPALVLSANGLYMSHCMMPGDVAWKAQFLVGVIVHFLGDAVACAPPRVPLEALVYDFERVKSRAGIERLAAPLDKAAKADVVRLLDTADAVIAKARRATAGRQFAKAWMLRKQARDAAEEAFCRAFPSKKVEGRGCWIHGPDYKNWDKLLAKLSAGGINQFFPNLCSPAYADYQSDLLPPGKVFKERGDQLKQILAAGRKHGVEVHVWMVNFYLMRASKAFLRKMAAEGRVTRRRDGRGQPQFLCPSDPRNQKLVADAMVEITEKYHPDGIHFDYIRYQSEAECFCAGCKRRFTLSAGRKINKWDDVSRDAGLAKKWVEFRCNNITAVVADVAKRSRAIDPNVKISAAVFHGYPRTRRGIGQDWKLWIDKGYVDFVCPMDYTTDLKTFDLWTRGQARLVANKVPFYPGIGSYRLGSAWRVVNQIAAARANGAHGMTFFQLNDVFLEKYLPLLGKGPFRHRAVPPHREK